LPLTEVDYVRAGLGIRSTDLNIGLFQFDREYIDEDGNLQCDDQNDNGICPEVYLIPRPFDPLSRSLDHNGDGVLDDKERDFFTLDFTSSWSRDTRNHFLNPTRGSSQRLGIEASLPLSDRQFYKLYYRAAKYWPIWGDLVFSVRGDLGYGDSYDNYDSTSKATPVLDDEGGWPESDNYNCLLDEVTTLDTGLPFFEHFYGGGVRDIRGFEDNTLGPKDSPINCRAVGGDLKVAGGFELAIPTPFTKGGGSRIALFFDIGNVYENWSTFDASRFRSSAGLSVTWQAPIGPIIMNYSFPIKKFQGDRTEALQFSFGTTF
jgi:outer membrane protein insertion porin family